MGMMLKRIKFVLVIYNKQLNLNNLNRMKKMKVMIMTKKKIMMKMMIMVNDYTICLEL